MKSHSKKKCFGTLFVKEKFLPFRLHGKKAPVFTLCELFAAVSL